MMIAQALSLFALCIPAALSLPLKGGVNIEKEGPKTNAGVRGLCNGCEEKKKKTSKGRDVTLTFMTNHRNHHFGLFFVMVHDETVDPIYVPGEAPIPGLNSLCNEGFPFELADAFENQDGVYSVEAIKAVLFGSGWTSTELDLSDPLFLFGINTLALPVTVPDNHLVTVIAMIGNSNDGCIFLNAVELEDGENYDMIEVDAGTEANEESCTTIVGCSPPPLEAGTSFDDLCPCGSDGNEGDQPAGEGYMSQHMGLGGKNEGLLDESDWRTHMVSVIASFD